ncbi:MAG: TAXI family TRAP transporter solute-binding subunit [Burkholderiaceae bacterium]
MHRISFRISQFAKAGAIGSAMAVALAVPSISHAKYDLTLCGASPGGLWSLLGAGVDAAVKAAHPGSTVTYQTSGGGFANIGQLKQKKCDLALVHDAEAIAAVNGKAPFKEAQNHLRTLAVMYTWAPMQLIVNKEFASKHGIETLEDIATKKVPVRILLNKRGNVASQVGADMLSAAGASTDDIKKWGGQVTFAASKEQGELMRDRRADAILNSLFVGHGSIRQLAKAIDVTLLPVGETTASKVISGWKIAPFTVPATAYDWAPKDTSTVTLAAQLFVNEDADQKMVTDVTQALIDHADKVSGVHKAMKKLDAKLMAAGTAVPYHEASATVYKSAGLQ